MKTGSIKFNSYQEEVEYIKRLRKEKSFLINNGYLLSIPRIFNREIYNLNIENNKKKLAEITKKWHREEKMFYQKLEHFFQKKIEISVKIKFTAYGPGGHYFFRNKKIVVKINSSYDPILIIKHEVVHFLVEPYIRKYKIDHKSKESLVDAVLNVL